jgi:tetratricopeptide (TPR) repeat protein
MSATMTPEALSASFTDSAAERLLPYVPRLVVEWARDEAHARWKQIDGTLAFIDISGFTSMTERLARKGKVGAEEMNDVLNALFGELLAVAYDDGAGLVKWGGDAGLLLFDGPDHAIRACRAGINMQKTIRRVGKITTSVGKVRLRMSIGMHSGAFDFFLVGDPEIHRELVLVGPATTSTVLMEQTAEAGEVAVSSGTAALVEPRTLGEPKEEAILLRDAAADVPFRPARPGADPGGVDIAQFIPVAIREHLLAEDENPEHRRITAAFLEFIGSDDLYAREGPEAVGEAVDASVRLVQKAALDHGVSFFETDVARNAWRIMMIAGAPRNLGGDEDRMLATLRTIVEAELPFPVKIGTNGGHVFAGHFGPPFRRTYSVKGDAVNTSARIMAKTEPGKIYASATVLEAASAAYETVELPPFAAKGKKKPLQAWSVGRRTGSKAGDLELPFVGRRHEIREFVEQLDDARSGQGAAVELVGPAGIGKTRLLTELTDQATEFRVLRALCEAYQQQIAYRPFRALLRAALDIPRDAPNEAAAARLRERVEKLAPELLPWLPLLGVVTDIEVPSTTEVDEIGEQFKRGKLEEVTVAFMSALLTEPTLFTVEDVHWLDEGSVGLLTRLAADVGKRPWVLALTRRPEKTGFVLVEQDRSRSLLVHPFEQGEAEILIGAATEAHPLRRHDIDALTDRAAGNPLFLSQLLAGVLRTGSQDLPLTVESLVTEEIDRLPRNDRLVLRVAAVLGMEVSEELLASLLEVEGLALDPSVWTRIGEFIEASAPGHRRFRHALMRETAYEGLPFRRRREMHGRAGVMIIADADDPAEQAELLSHHFFAAHSHFDAWAYSAIAGRRARAKYANADAASFFARAIDSGRRAAVEAPRLADIHEELGDVRLVLNEFDDARGAYAAGRKLVPDDPVRQGRFLLQEAKAHYRGGRFADAIRSIRRGMRLLEADDSPEGRKLYARLGALYAGTRVSQGKYRDAEEWCRRIMATSDEVGELEALARAYYIFDFVCMDQGRVEEAVYSGRAAELYAQLGDLANQAEVIANSASDAHDQGRWVDAIDLLQRSLELRRRLGDDSEAAICAANMAEIRLDQGRTDVAEELLVEAARAPKAGGYQMAEAYITGLLGRVATQRGHFKQAMRDLEAARSMWERIGYRSFVFEVEVRMAEALVGAGDPEAALERARRALRVASELGGIPARVPLLHRVRGMALVALGRLAEARPAFEVSAVMARARQSQHEVGLTLHVLAELDRLEGLPVDPSLGAESEAILAQLDLVRFPALPCTRAAVRTA